MGNIKKYLHLLLTLVILQLPVVRGSWNFFQYPNPAGTSKEAFQTAISSNAESEHLSSRKLSDTEIGDEPIIENGVPSSTLWQSFFSDFSFAMPTVLNKLILHFKAIIMFKPPVGITSIFVIFNLFLKRNRKFVESLLMDNEDMSIPKALSSSRRRRKRIGRSLNLDSADMNYDSFGGVDTVRTQLCLAALSDLTKEDKQIGSTSSVPNYDPFRSFGRAPSLDKHVLTFYAAAAREALEINPIPQTTREYFVERLIKPLANLEGFYKYIQDQKTNKRGHPHSIEDEWTSIVWTASKVAEVRALDALLRIIRERLLMSAMRLTRKEKLRRYRLSWSETKIGRIWRILSRRMLKGYTLSDDRMNLQLTSAALKREMERLGEIQKMLLSRPVELSETRLLTASSLTIDDILEDYLTDGDGQKDVTGKQDYVGQIDSNGAKIVLTSNSNPKRSQGGLKTEPDPWKNNVQSWARNSRELISDLVEESLSSFDSDECFSSRDSCVGDDLTLLSQWAQYERNDKDGWDTALTLADDLSKARLLREKKYLPSAFDLRYWAKRFDIFGIPSSIATIAAAWLVHEVVRPFWPRITSVVIASGNIVWGIIEYRFWVPFRDIVLDLLNKRPKLLDPFELKNEETSLDNMLRDLGVSDGSKGSRAEGLAAASRMYEEELAKGTLRNLFRGRMVQLLLIQLQQLKAGSLEAMGTIDEMVESNRFNVQLLASIPAFLLASIGTRIFFAALYSLRSRDLVGLPSAHAEMSDILNQMERCLLLASYSKDRVDDEMNGKTEIELATTSNVVLQPKELGRFIILMYSYLVILDYCNPPFSNRACDSIHSGMQGLLLEGQLTTKRQIALLQLIKSEHKSLL